MEYDDRRLVIVKLHEAILVDAAAFAIDLADRAGRFHRVGDGLPNWVKIFRGDHLEIAISVPTADAASAGEAESPRRN